MTDKQINKAIAKACEWTGHPFCTDMAGNPFPGWDEPPDYCNDLNRMHEAEKVLLKMDNSQAYWYTYSNKLTTLLGCTDLFHATARERAETFLKTISNGENT